MFEQASYFANPLPVELLPSIPVYGNLLSTGIYIGEVADYALKALVFISKNFNETVQVVGEICAYLCDNGTAFSLLISDCGEKVFLFPQVITSYLSPCWMTHSFDFIWRMANFLRVMRFCEILAKFLLISWELFAISMQVRAPFRYQLSAWECGGYFVYDTQSDFNRVTELDISNLLASVSLDAHNFKTLKQQCCTAVSKYTIWIGLRSQQWFNCYSLSFLVHRVKYYA